MMNKLSKYLIPALFGILILSNLQCTKDIEGVEIQNDASYAIPLFYGNISLQDMIRQSADSTSLLIDADGNMTFQYSGDIVSRTSKEIYEDLPPIPAIVTDTFFGIPVKLANNIKIRKIILTDGTLFFTYKSFHTQDVTMKITIPELVKNGKSWSITRFVNYTNTVPVQDIILPVSIAGWTIDLPNDTMHIRYEAIKADGQRDTVSNFALLAQTLKFSYVEGFFGYEVFPIKRDTIELNIYQNLLGGELNFKDPRVTTRVFNSFGFPVRSLSKIIKFGGKNGETYDLVGPFITNGFDFNYPSLSEVGKTVVTTAILNTSNSNIGDIINANPIYLDYQIDAVANPEKDPSIIGFMTDSSKFTVNLTVDLPVYGKAKDFNIQDEFDVNFGQLDGFESAEFKLLTENTMPVDLAMQLYFVDAGGLVLDSLFIDKTLIVKGAPVDPNGNAVGKSKFENYISCDAAKLSRIKAASKARVKAFLTTSQNGAVHVKILASQGLDVKMGVIGKIKNKI